MSAEAHFTPAAELLARIVTVSFGLTGAVITVLAGIREAHLQLVLFSLLLLLNTYFSIRCFASVPESHVSPLEKITNVVLAVLYAGLAALMAHPSWFAWVTVIMFFVAAFKYALIDSKEFSGLLRRKIMIDLLGGIGSAITLATLPFAPLNAVLWTWLGVFAIGNVYVIWMSALYRPVKD